MAALRVTEHAKPRLTEPTFVEGLPGIGHVGKLAAQHLVDSLRAKPWLTIHSPDFPPQVAVDDDGIVRLPTAKLWTVGAAGKAPALVVMTGDAQPLTAQGQHEFVEAVLDRLEPLGCRTVLTLGGYGTGRRVPDPAVHAAATDKAMLARLRKAGAPPPGDEGPGAAIVGASGLFLGLAALRGWTGACLMAETNGYLVDPHAARAVLGPVAKLLGRRIDLGGLAGTAADLDRITAQLSASVAPQPRDGPEHYIG